MPRKPKAEPNWTYHVGDCLHVMHDMTPDSVDLVFGSPPYEDCRDYDVGFKKRSRDWMFWAIRRFMVCLRVSKGLVCWVVDSPTRNYLWSPGTLMLMHELVKHGVILRKPPIFHRVSTPGSGGRDWLRNDYEFVLCAQKHRGRLPWADPKAMGQPCKYPRGGDISHRTARGTRKKEDYHEPDIANPGNVVSLGAMGKGNMGHILCHENEAPFPERLAEFFIRSFCPPGGTVLDPFAGSGTTLQVALQHGRKAIGIDCRSSQRKLTERRLKNVSQE